MRTTVLHPAHLRLAAKMTDFGGWEMPLHYGSQLEEHHAVRGDCGMFDISHMCAVDVAGTGARAFLRRLLANDVDKLALAGKALYAVMLNPQGGVMDDLIVYRMEEGNYRLVVNAATADKDLGWMAARLAEWRADARLQPRRDLAMIAVQGPRAHARLAQAMPGLADVCAGLGRFQALQAGEVFVARTGYTGEDGFEIALPADRAEALWQGLHDAGTRPCGLGARDTLRLEAGMNLYGQDMDEETSPLDAGLGWTVDLGAGRDFVGRAALESAGQRSQLLGLVLLERGVLRAHQPVSTPAGTGEITSGTYSPTLARAIGLARLPLGVACGDTVQVEIRDKLHPARVVRPPFVRAGQILVNL